MEHNDQKTTQYEINSMLLKGVTPLDIMFKCQTYLSCRLQNRLWMTGPEYQTYDSRLPVNLGKERTITVSTHSCIEINENVYQIIYELLRFFFSNTLVLHYLRTMAASFSKPHSLQNSYINSQSYP